MKKLFRRFKRAQEGMIAVESCLGVTVFMLLMLTMYSLVPLFMAQNMISHALTESCQSLAYETYGTSKLKDGEFQVADVPLLFVKLQSKVHSWVSNSPYDKEQDAHYATDEKWYKVEPATDSVSIDYSAVEDVARDRFATYLAGGTSAADATLTKLGIIDGLDGIDFTGTKVNGSDLVISIEYNILPKIHMNAFGSDGFTSKQQVCSRLWGS